MLSIDNGSIIKQHEIFMQALANNSRKALMQRDFFERIFPKLAKETEFAYPHVVGIPKSIDELIEGDFNPAYTITVKEPVKGIYTDNWFGNTIDGFYLHGCGFVNGDNRYLSEQKLDDADIHMVLAGATGQGKSVTLNSIILTLCSEYAPWELNLTMCDAKIVEFKTYATKFPMPHIRSVAATEDADYLISVLDDIYKEMITMNTIFTRKGSKNIKEFRKQFIKRNSEGKIVSYLAIPQNLIVIDEFQTMFKMAKKRSDEIAGIIDSIGRLGRNTGYHMMLASQELGTDLPKATLNNIKVRAAMGCFPAVSTMILGNDEAAKNYGIKGALIVNNDPTIKEGKKDNKESNKSYRVPFAPDNELAEIGQSIIRNGKMLGYQRTLSFYDEQKHLYKKNYKSFLKSFKHRTDRILLGEPAFVMSNNGVDKNKRSAANDNSEQVVKLVFEGKDIENICVHTISNNNFKRYFYMLKTNVELIKEYNLEKCGDPKIMNIVICGDPMYSTECDAEKIATPGLFFDNKSYDNNKGFAIAASLINRRKIMLEADKKCLKMEESNNNTDKMFDSLELPGYFDNSLNRSRCFYIWETLVNEQQFRQAFFGGNKSTIPQDKLKALLTNMFKMYEKYNLLDTYATYEDLPQVFVWILGLNKIQGLGRDTRSKNVEALKQLMLDASSVNIRYIVFTNTFDDMADLSKNGIRWFLCDTLNLQMINRIGASDYYPTQISGGLCVLYDKIVDGPKCRKFKKMFFDGEVIS